MPTAHLTIMNPRGLHARAAARFVKLAAGFDAEISVAKGGQEVSGSSIMGLMTLAAAIGQKIRITTEGPEAEAALAALAKLVKSRFEEG
jgi:phosphocarrier protein